MDFSQQIDADLPLFVEPTEFAITAQVGGQPVNGIFDPGLEGDREPRSPSFLCQESLVTINHGGLVVIQGQNYWLEGYRPDGTGMVQLILRKQ